MRKFQTDGYSRVKNVTFSERSRKGERSRLTLYEHESCRVSVCSCRGFAEVAVVRFGLTTVEVVEEIMARRARVSLAMVGFEWHGREGG